MQVFLFMTKKFSIPGYTLTRADHTGNVKCLGICIYYKSFLALRVLNFGFLNKFLNPELLIGMKFCNFLSLSG